MVGARQQVVDVFGISACCGVLAQNGEVGGHLAIEQGQLLQLSTRQMGQSALVGMGQQGGEPVPVRPSLGDPLV